MNHESVVLPEEIPEWIRFACERCQCPHLVHRIACRFNDRMTIPIARALTEHHVGFFPGIELSTVWWERLNDTGRRNVIIHETCHFIAAHLHGPDIPGHGAQWKWAMRRCGLLPNVYLDERELTEEFRRCDDSDYLLLARCRCRGHRQITIRLANRIRAGENIRCELCRKPIALLYG